MTIFVVLIGFSSLMMEKYFYIYVTSLLRNFKLLSIHPPNIAVDYYYYYYYYYLLLLLLLLLLLRLLRIHKFHDSNHKTHLTDMVFVVLSSSSSRMPIEYLK